MLRKKRGLGDKDRTGSTILGDLGKNIKQGFFIYLNIYWIFYLFYLKSIFLDAKLLIKFLYLSSSNISFSIDNMANPLNLFYNIVNLK